MKQKILEALKQGHKNLGLSDEAFERVANLGKTFITSEEQIPDFVKDAEAILKAEQSAADKYRTELTKVKNEYEGKITDLEAKLNGGDPKPQEGNNEPPKQEPDPQDLATLIANAVATAVKPLNDKIEAFESGQAAKKALVDAEANFKSNDWVKKYPDEADDSWERAVELNQATGSKKSAEELAEMALGYFSKAVSRKGDDISKPFKSEGSGNDEPDFSPFDRVVAKQKAESGNPQE